MNIDDWVAKNRSVFETEYELLFSRTVLPLVDGLQFTTVQAQYPFVDREGKKRYCDFAIIESEMVQLALEVDGYDKRGTGAGMSREDFVDWQRRQASLASQGWHVLRFANVDVRDRPQQCADHISDLLKRLRQVERGRPVARERGGLPSVGTSGSAAMGPVKRSVKGSIFLVFFSAFAFAGLMNAIGDPANPVSAPSKVSNALTSAVSVSEGYGALACENPIDWSQARKFIGTVVTIKGPLLATTARHDIAGGPIWLDVGGVFPSRERLNVVVWRSNWDKFDARKLSAEYWHTILGDEMEYASICVKGRIDEYRGVPQIELRGIHQLKIFL